MGKQDILEKMKKNEPFTDRVKQTALETIGDVKDTTKAIEVIREEEYAPISKTGDLMKNAINFDLRLVDSLGEAANF